MICAHCQKEIADYSNFCYFCGSKQAAAAAAPKSRAGRRLMRSAKDKKVAGVCAGFADYLDVDVTVIRLVWVLLTIFTGFVGGIFAYVVAWLIMPVAPETRLAQTTSTEPVPHSS